MCTRCLGEFSVMWVTKLMIPQVKKGFFAPKRQNLAQTWHFWWIWARPCRFFRCPVGGSVGGCGARAVSRKTPIYFIIHFHTHQHFFYFEYILILINISFTLKTFLYSSTFFFKFPIKPESSACFMFPFRSNDLDIIEILRHRQFHR